MISLRVFLSGLCVFLSAVWFPNLTFSKTPSKKAAKSKLLTSQHIVPPRLGTAPRSLLQPNPGRIHLHIKLVYAHTRSRKHIDIPLRKDVSEFKHLYGFNAYQLIRSRFYTLSYKKQITVRVSKRYEIRLVLKGFNTYTKKIALQAQFFYRKALRKGRSKMTAYATTDIRIKRGRKVTFVGPAHLSGRALLLLHAK